MIPTTLSATACDTANTCLRRYEAEHMHRSKGFSSGAATLGSTVHAALEDYVSAHYLTARLEPDLAFLLDRFEHHAKINFPNPGEEGVAEQLTDGREMLKGWFARATPILATRTVLSCETKTRFALPTSAGPIPFTYIFDRFDLISEGVYEVVDYKTNRWGLNPQDLRQKLQARTYALAAAMQLKAQGVAVKEIWVRFDLLRHIDVATKFTFDDNLETWNKLIEIAESILATPDGHAKPTLNSTCLFCPVKTTCSAVLTNIASGGILSLSEADLVDLRAKLEFQSRAVAATMKDVDAHIMGLAQEADTLSYTSDHNRLSIGVSRRRTVDADMVEMAVGPALFDRYGGRSITLKQFESLLADPSLDPAEVPKLKALIGTKISDPKIKIESRTFVDE